MPRRKSEKSCRKEPKNSGKSMKKICIHFPDMTIITNEELTEFVYKYANLYTKIGENPKKRFFQVLYKILNDFILML